MSEQGIEIARNAAGLLASRYGAQLPMELEKLILRADVEGMPPEHYIGLTEAGAAAGVAAFILQCAQFAWQIYHDTRDKDAIRRRLRLEVRPPAGLRVAQRDDVIEVVVDNLPEA